MKRTLLATAFVLALGLAQASAQNGPMYGGDKLFELFGKVNEVVVHMPGFEYQYVGDWLSGMKLEDPNTISFTRGRVKHSFDIRRVVFLQDEGRYIKLWIN